MNTVTKTSSQLPRGLLDDALEVEQPAPHDPQVKGREASQAPRVRIRAVAAIEPRETHKPCNDPHVDGVRLGEEVAGTPGS